MPDLLIRAVPDDVASFFREQARLHNRSMRQELVEALRAHAADTVRRRKAIEDMRAIREATRRELPASMQPSESVGLIREDRER